MRNFKRFAFDCVYGLLAGESTEVVATMLADIEGRWDTLAVLLSETVTKVNLNIQSKKFYDELHALQELMSSYEKWVSSAERIAEEALEITKQLEQCRVCLYENNHATRYN